jgi:hypothetical protein
MYKLQKDVWLWLSLLIQRIRFQPRYGRVLLKGFRAASEGGLKLRALQHWSIPRQRQHPMGVTSQWAGVSANRLSWGQSGSTSARKALVIRSAERAFELGDLPGAESMYLRLFRELDGDTTKKGAARAEGVCRSFWHVSEQ